MVYLIPANSKKGMLIFGIFRPFDLILFLTGVFVSLIMLMFVPLTSTLLTVLVLIPALICSLLVLPVPFYHNTLHVIVSLYYFLTNRQKYIWKGWSIDEETKEKK